MPSYQHGPLTSYSHIMATPTHPVLTLPQVTNEPTQHQESCTSCPHINNSHQHATTTSSRPDHTIPSLQHKSSTSHPDIITTHPYPASHQNKPPASHPHVSTSHPYPDLTSGQVTNIPPPHHPNPRTSCPHISTTHQQLTPTSAQPTTIPPQHHHKPPASYPRINISHQHVTLSSSRPPYFLFSHQRKPSI